MACVIAGGKKTKEEPAAPKSATKEQPQPKAQAATGGSVSLSAGGQGKEARKNKKCEC
jgi:hypothetical protein